VVGYVSVLEGTNPNNVLKKQGKSLKYHTFALFDLLTMGNLMTPETFQGFFLTHFNLRDPSQIPPTKIRGSPHNPERGFKHVNTFEAMNIT